MTRWDPELKKYVQVGPQTPEASAAAAAAEAAAEAAKAAADKK